MRDWFEVCVTSLDSWQTIFLRLNRRGSVCWYILLLYHINSKFFVVFYHTTKIFTLLQSPMRSGWLAAWLTACFISASEWDLRNLHLAAESTCRKKGNYGLKTVTNGNNKKEKKSVQWIDRWDVVKYSNTFTCGDSITLFLLLYRRSGVSSSSLQGSERLKLHLRGLIVFLLIVNIGLQDGLNTLL